MIKTKDFPTFKSAKMLKSVAVIVGAASLMLTTVHADQLDTVIKRGTLNCGVVLDFPPMGYFD
ncbi:MAG: hypothetical protein MUQ76_13550, partial [Reinekea forsetii]|nr:hypothetical protein [Reinekea forsetii]